MHLMKHCDGVGTLAFKRNRVWQLVLRRVVDGNESVAS